VTGRRLVVEADGGSRGNPGPAAYGALVQDAETGELLNEDAKFLGVTTNNVAEYSGLVSALRMAKAIDPTAQVLARMDSKLVVEQMSGRWKIKHEDMRRLALEARAILPRDQVTYQWIPRALNSAADRLANEAMDLAAKGREWQPKRPAYPGAVSGADRTERAVVGRGGTGGPAQADLPAAERDRRPGLLRAGERGSGRGLPVARQPGDHLRRHEGRGRAGARRPAHAGFRRMTYAGDLTPAEAYDLVRDNPGAVLVDVRTTAEWAQIGIPDLSEIGKEVVLLQWQQSPDGSLNPDFTAQLAEAVTEGAPVLMLCRSGVRSVAAANAATAAGIGPAYNVTEGFEGGVDASGRRGATGWRAAGLPWRQQ
jgi:ribonuclease HI/rhodanese-related sulfurtransferase